MEYAPDARVRLVSPGFVRTRLTDKNDFEMPSLLGLEDAATAIADRLQGNRFEIHFPRTFTWKVKLLRALHLQVSARVTMTPIHAANEHLASNAGRGRPVRQSAPGPRRTSREMTA